MVRRRVHDPAEDVWSSPNWPPRIEKMFVGSLVEEMKYHLDVMPSNFHDQAWENVVKDLNQCSDWNFNKAELKKHLSILRKRYRIVKPLYDHGGFGWNNRRKMVVVDDSVWDEYIKVHPEITPYRKYGCPIYKELCHIFTRPKATGEFAVSSMDPGSNPSERNKHKLTEPPKSGSNKRNSVGPNNPKRSKSSDMDQNQNQKDDPYSIANCVVALNDTPGVDRRLYNAAMDLFENKNWRETFVTMKMDKRLSWLKAMIPRKT
ncbi:uncharacterized protein LOC125825175 [Solanum verrucosum]|uniref:uncharacterized protein LOC125825175 n=1 Tax=Solanum verrucosum TaxID=315347 RepID=UPI0020D0D0A0|nr:uncharacterized protein LOC125825175 [Solanum verrucosum]